MQWILINQYSRQPLNESQYSSERIAATALSRLGDVFENLYYPIPVVDDPKWETIIMEGLVAGDLEGILLPQFSIDVYVPNNNKTDNIVVGFLIKGVPEAVFPFKNFCTYANGVEDVDYGESDTLPNTSVVYVEFERAKFKVVNLFDLINQVCKIAALDAKDLSVNFPTSNESYPYDKDKVRDYFSNRNRDKNRLSQYKANSAHEKQLEKELEDESNFGSIGKRLGGSGYGQPGYGQAGYTPTVNNLRTPGTVHKGLAQLQSPITGNRVKPKKQIEFEVPETVKASIVADARRNRVNHQVQWKDFDSAWAQRLHVSPTKISSIRKTIYDR